MSTEREYEVVVVRRRFRNMIEADGALIEAIEAALARGEQASEQLLDLLRRYNDPSDDFCDADRIHAEWLSEPRETQIDLVTAEGPFTT